MAILRTVVPARGGVASALNGATARLTGPATIASTGITAGSRPDLDAIV